VLHPEVAEQPVTQGELLSGRGGEALLAALGPAGT
jgi:hypothetical protein